MQNSLEGGIMCTEIMEQKNVCLDQIMAERRSHRMFQPEFPPEDAITRIIHAGLLAPFAVAAVDTHTIISACSL